MRWRLRFAQAAAAFLAVLAVLAIVVRLGPETAPGRAFLERSLDGLDLGPAGKLGVEGLSGDPWRAASIRRLTLSDARGVWLDARGVRVEWRPLDLLDRRVRVELLTIDDLRLQRRPAARNAARGAASPVGVLVDRLRARVEMSPAFAGVRGDYGVGGRLDWERSGALRVSVTAVSRLHAGDRLYARGALTPDKRFFLIADAREAKGGALAGSLGLAGDQPFLLHARAAGSLRQGHVAIDTKVGAVSPLLVNADWTPQGGQASGVLLLGASRLLAPYAAMFGPRVDFQATGRQAPAGFADVSISAKAANATLLARGPVNVERETIGPAGLALRLAVADGRRLLDYPKLGAVQAAGLLKGVARRWSFLGMASANDVDFDGYRLARAAGPLSMHNEGRDLVVEASPSAEGGVGAPLAAALLGPRPHGSATLAWLADGRLLVRQASLSGAGMAVQATGARGLLGDLSFRGTARFANLALAHPGARGVVAMEWKASQSGRGPWALTIDAHGVGFATGFADADHLLGPAPQLTAKGQWDGRAFTFADAALAGAAAKASGAGVFGGDGSISLKFTWNAAGPLTVGPLEIDGAAHGAGQLAGDWDAPRIGLAADLGATNVLGLPLKSAHLDLAFAGVGQGGAGRIDFTGVGPQGGASAKSAFRFAGDGVDLTGLSLEGGGVTASGSVSLRGGSPSEADLTLAVGPGLLLQQGHAEGRIKVAGSPGGAHAQVRLAGGEAILAAGGVAVKRFNLDADGPVERLPFHLAADGPSQAGQWKIVGAGDISAAGADHVVRFSGEGRLREADLKTLAPAEIRLGAGGLAAHATLAVGSGRAVVDFADTRGATKLDAALTDVQLALLDRDYVGAFSGRLSMAGHGPSLAGELDAHLSHAGGRDLRGAPPVDGRIQARLAANTVNVTFDLGNSAGLASSGTLALPVRASAQPFMVAVDGGRPMNGRFAVKGEIKPVWDLLFTGAENLSGRVDADVTVGGTPDDPRLEGGVAIDGGRLQDEDTGLQLQDVSLRAALQGEAIDVSNFSAVDGLKGSVSGSGRASLARDGASSFRATLSGFRLIDTDFARVTASGPFTFSRTAAGKIQISGALTVDSAQIAPNPPVANGVTPLDVVEIHRPVELDDAPGGSSVASAREAPIGLDVAIRAPGRVFVKGRGLDLELSLNAHVSGTAAAPVLTGTAHVVRGDYDFAGQRFRIDDRGVVYLASTPEDIRLDLTATREDPSLTAVIHIGGVAAKPIITLTSTPALPKDEILSRVLFGASASQLSGLQAAQLASAIAGLSGGRGFDLIGGLRSLAHLDRLAIGGTAATGTTFSGGKYITDRLYLQLTGGGREGRSAQLEWQIRKRLSLVAKFGAEGNSQIAIRWRRSH